jgi:hypothetical protein
MKTYPAIKHHNMKTYVEMDLAPPCLNSALDGDEWPASRTAALPPGKEPLGRRLSGPRAGLEAVAKRKKSHPCPLLAINPRSSTL